MIWSLINNIDKSRLDTIQYDDNDCMTGCKCNKCKQYKLINQILHIFF